MAIYGMSSNPQQAVRKAIDASNSIRSLAREAGVSEALLRMMRDGERTATHQVLLALAQGLERKGRQFLEVAEVVRKAAAAGKR